MWRLTREFWIGLAVSLGAVALCVLSLELAMRLIDKPAPIISGWRGNPPPLNQLGWRGRPIDYAPDDFVVVLVGDSQVECRACPPDETLDLVLERALRRHIPNARVVTLGASGHGTDQEYLALREYLDRYRADLVIAWLTIGNDIINNLARSAGGGYHRFHPKPTFWMEGDQLRGPTETIDAPVVTGKLRILWHRAFEDFETDWARRIPASDPGSSKPPESFDRVVRTFESVEEQRSLWSILQTPRPARIDYGIRLTRALLLRMKELAESKGAAFVVMREDNFTPEAVRQAARFGLEMYLPGKTAVEHNGHWILAEEATYHATVRDTTEGLQVIAVPIRVENPRISPQDHHYIMAGNRQMMADLAAMLMERPNLIGRARRVP